MLEPLLPRLKREIEARLAELRPAVAEAAHLEAAKRALLEDLAPSASTSRRVSELARELSQRTDPVEGARVRAAGSPARSTVPSGLLGSRLSAASPSAGALGASPRTSTMPVDRSNGGEANGEAPRSTNRDVILALVEERPGVSVAEISSVTKIAKPTVATTVSKLKRDGLLADEAGGVKLASRQPLTLEQIAKVAAARDEGVDDAEWEAAQPSAKAAR